MEYKRLTTTSLITDSPTLKALCESCGESGCDELCSDYQEKGCAGCPVQIGFERLSAYEDSGLSPKQVQEAQDAMKKALGMACELQSYRNAKAEDRMVVLPCKVGDTVHWIDQFSDEIYKSKVDEITICKGKMIIDYLDLTADDFGKTVFHTMEEAEKALRNESQI